MSPIAGWSEPLERLTAVQPVYSVPGMWLIQRVLCNKNSAGWTYIYFRFILIKANTTIFETRGPEFKELKPRRWTATNGFNWAPAQISKHWTQFLVEPTMFESLLKFETWLKYFKFVRPLGPYSTNRWIEPLLVMPWSGLKKNCLNRWYVV